MKSLVVVPSCCTGCHRCEMACSFAHFNEINPARSAIHVISAGHIPLDAPVFCIQCGLCVDVCPVNAISRDEKINSVVVDLEKCTGCGDCVDVCPIGAASLDPESRKAIKCDLCGGDPKCVKFYDVCGWNEEGVPTKSKLKELGLENTFS